MTDAASRSDGTGAWGFTLRVDPSRIGTAQQKRYDRRTGRFFTDRRVAAGMKAVAYLAKAAMTSPDAKIPPSGASVALGLVFYYAVPRTRRRASKRANPPCEGSPCTARWAGDCDNRAKSVVDALTAAGMWPDDQFVTRLEVRKAWTLGAPRIEVAVSEDFGLDGRRG